MVAILYRETMERITFEDQVCNGWEFIHTEENDSACKYILM